MCGFESSVLFIMSFYFLINTEKTKQTILARFMYFNISFIHLYDLFIDLLCGKPAVPLLVLLVMVLAYENELVVEKTKMKK